MLSHWLVFCDSLSGIVVGLSFAVLWIGTMWRFIKERNYPLCYRIFDYVGCFLFFMCFPLGIITGKLLEVNETIRAGLVGLFFGGGIFCIGIAAKLFPESENDHALYKRKQFWKMFVGIGAFIILCSLDFFL